MLIAAQYTDGFVTLAWCGALLLIVCAFGALGEKYLMRRDRRHNNRDLRRRINQYGGQR